MDMNALHVVIGARGGAGFALVQELASQGRRVRGVTRTGRLDELDVETAAGDALDRTSLLAACQGASIIYHCANVPYPEWLAKLPLMMSNVIQVAGQTNAPLVYADNLYAYGKSEAPFTEETPYHPMGRKGALRAQLANTLLEAHRRGSVRAVIGRASDFFGSRANSTAGNLVMRNLIAGKKAMWIASLDAPHTFTYLPDFARGLISLAGHEEAWGQVWHVPTDVPLTGRQFLTLASEYAGVKPNLGAYSRSTMRLVALFSPLVREALEEYYQFEAPFIMDSSKFAHAFGAQVTSNEEAISRTVEWYKNN